MLEEEEEEEEEKLGNLVRANEERSRGSQPRFGWEGGRIQRGEGGDGGKEVGAPQGGGKASGRRRRRRR